MIRKDEWEKIVVLYRSDKKLKEIANDLGISVTCVAMRISMLRKMGVNLPYRRCETLDKDLVGKLNKIK